MLDLIKLSIPFKEDYLSITKELNGVSISYVDLNECMERGVSMEAKTLTMFNGSYTVQDLRHPYQALPSSFTQIAFKIFQGSPLRASCVELKCSPAKILQGHNVFGGDSIEAGAVEMIMCLMRANLDFFEMLDVESTTLDALDCTFSCRVENDVLARQAIRYLSNVSNKSLRKSSAKEFETTVYFNKGSRHCERVIYLKEHEFKKQLSMLQDKQKKGFREYDSIIDAMSDPRLINYTKNLIRFEAKAKRRYLDKFKVPNNLFKAIEFQKEYDGNLILDIWKEAYKNLIESLEGEIMNVHDDKKIRQLINDNYKVVTKSGNVTYTKANNLFNFYRAMFHDGYEYMKESQSKTTFNRNMALLVDIGIPKAHLTGLTGDNSNSNVIPLCRVINFDFANQTPDWFKEVKAGSITRLYSVA